MDPALPGLMDLVGSVLPDLTDLVDPVFPVPVDLVDPAFPGPVDLADMVESAVLQMTATTLTHLFYTLQYFDRLDELLQQHLADPNKLAD